MNIDTVNNIVDHIDDEDVNDTLIEEFKDRISSGKVFTMSEVVDDLNLTLEEKKEVGLE